MIEPYKSIDGQVWRRRHVSICVWVYTVDVTVNFKSWVSHDGKSLHLGHARIQKVLSEGIQTSIAKKTYIFVIFQWGSGPPPPSGSTHEGFHSMN